MHFSDTKKIKDEIIKYRLILTMKSLSNKCFFGTMLIGKEKRAEKCS